MYNLYCFCCKYPVLTAKKEGKPFDLRTLEIAHKRTKRVATVNKKIDLAQIFKDCKKRMKE